MAHIVGVFSEEDVDSVVQALADAGYTPDIGRSVNDLAGFGWAAAAAGGNTTGIAGNTTGPGVIGAMAAGMFTPRVEGDADVEGDASTSERDYYDDAIREGAVVVSVRVDDRNAGNAQTIMQRHNGQNVATR